MDEPRPDQGTGARRLGHLPGQGAGAGVTLGRVMGIPVRLGPSWFLVAALITWAFAPVVDRWVPGLGGARYLVSFAFAVFLYASVFLHELGHALTGRAQGLPVRGISLHFLGGHTELGAEGSTPGRDALVSAAGPAVSLLVGGVSLVAAAWAGGLDGNVAGFLLAQLAAANLLVGVFNLLPALPLDGGHLLRDVIWAVTGRRSTGTEVAARVGMALAGLVLLVPWLMGGRDGPSFVSLLWSVLVAWFLWTGAQRSLVRGRVLDRLAGVTAGPLARPAISVPADTPVAELVRRAAAAGAGAVALQDSYGRVVGLVSEAAVAAVPEQRRPWVDAASVSRAVDDDLLLPADLAGEELVRRLAAHPATEYLVVDRTGTPVGILVTDDVERLLSTPSPRR